MSVVFFLPVITLWWREVVRFARQRSRVVSAFAQPLVFWVLLGGGLSASFSPPGAPDGMSYAEYLYPGILVLVLLFTAIFATIAVIEDRKSGFLQGVLVAPVPRMQIVLGQALGGTTLALLQGVFFLALAPTVGIVLIVPRALVVVLVMMVLSFALTCAGLTIAWRMDSVQGFHAIMNLILIPVWLLSGALFPAADLPGWLAWVVHGNPLTYGVAVLRRCLYLGDSGWSGQLPALTLSLVVMLLFAVCMFLVAVRMARRSP
jgi:ABC-2 type transport system permease protein